MEPATVVRIVILYLHPLLGEGLASLLSAELGVTVTAVERSDEPAVARALAAKPDLVVLEGADSSRTSGAPMHRSPSVYFTTMDARGRPVGPPLSDPEDVLDLARSLTRRPAAVDREPILR
jgi:DNA-binding NarL/FixJ family response regulator